MAVDPLSPVAPARIRALLLPVGRIKRSRFLAFVELLQPACMVRLGDVTPDPRPDRNMFSPLAFPAATLLYEFSTSLPPPSHLTLSPFEQFREPLLVVGIGDSAEYPDLTRSRAPAESVKNGPSAEGNAQEIRTSIDDLKEQLPRACLHSLMMFDWASSERHPALPNEAILVPPIEQLKATTMKTIMCDVSSTLLAEMTTLARSIQALPMVPSPSSLQNGTADTTPSWASADPSEYSLSRRNSQTPAGTRPESPGIGLQKDLHRMSMPVLPSSASMMSPDDSRATSPATPRSHTPPTTFEEISDASSPTTLNRSKPASKGFRDSSADRMSILGFGSGGVGERTRNKGLGRVSIVVGTLHLCAGQWNEAMKELIDGATRARAFSDHLWHGKALENILACLLLFAWAGLDFQIPQVCFSNLDKSSGTRSPQHALSIDTTDLGITASPKSSSRRVALDSLSHLIPDLVGMILNIYNRASNFPGEALPPLAFSECVIRFSKLLTAMNLSAGILDDDALHHLIENHPLRQKPRLSVPRLSVVPTRNDIAATLVRAMPGPPDVSGIGPIDRATVLAGIASVLSSLGLQRKKAIVMKEFITSLIPGLAHARKVGAAEMGVHPAAGLAALNLASGNASGAGALILGEGEVESGIDEFLNLLGRVYGIPDPGNQLLMPKVEELDYQHIEDDTKTDPTAAIIEDITRTANVRSYGSLGLKLDVLRMCISFCEALPDFKGQLQFTSMLLRIAGPGTAPKTNSTDVFVSLPRDEQARLYGNMFGILAKTHKLGLQRIETEYWDDFLVRGLSIVQEAPSLRLIIHQPAELSSVSSKIGPFLHNPWLKKPVTGTTETILVANQEYQFIIALQNPYDFELDVDSLRIVGEGVSFDAHEETFLLGPYRTQKFPIRGTARSSGTLRIMGCLIKVKGCRERLFPIFSDPWKPDKELKLKLVGLKACITAPVSRPSSNFAPSAEPDTRSLPKSEAQSFTVISEQPIATVTDISLPQASVMVLEGERKRFTITLTNTSKSSTIDFVHISFQDSATAAMQAASTNKDLPLAELHELEVQLAHYPSLKWCKKEAIDDSISIKPDGKATFEIEVVGRTRLTEATIQIDYANLGKRRSEITDRFFTRQVSVPISITVNASVQLHRPDIVPLSGDFAWTNQLEVSHERSVVSEIVSQTPSSPIIDQNNARILTDLHKNRINGHGDEHCMLLLDLRNSWPNPLSISLQVRNAQSNGEDTRDPWTVGSTVSDIIQPGHVNRVVLILPRVHLANPYASIPSLNPANQRQFVVSTSKISPDVERTSREAFWYREHLLNNIRGTWREEGSERHGSIELRSIRLSSPRMVDAMKLDDIGIEITLSADASETRGTGVHQVGRFKFEAMVDEFLTLKTKVHNRSATSITPLLRLQPHLGGLPHSIALDLDKRLSWNGVLQHRLPVIHSGQSYESEVGIVPLCSGVFEIGATVEEVELQNGVEDGMSDTLVNRTRSGTAAMLRGDLRVAPQLRSWFMREPCTVVVKKRE